jgi:hypothetical protein
MGNNMGKTGCKLGGKLRLGLGAKRTEAVEGINANQEYRAVA